MTSKNWLIATILAFVTICAWVAFGILHNIAKVEIPQETKQLIEPLNPNFDTSVLES